MEKNRMPMATTPTTVLNKDKMSVFKEQDVVPFRNRVKEYATKIGMGLVNQTKLITAASELVRNMLRYANGGEKWIAQRIHPSTRQIEVTLPYLKKRYTI